MRRRSHEGTGKDTMIQVEICINGSVACEGSRPIHLLGRSGDCINVLGCKVEKKRSAFEGHS